MNGNGTIDPLTEIKEENHYYPFGLKHKGYNNQITGRDHQYGYNGIEESNELEFNMLEMDLRQYDAAIARWVVIDPVTHYDYSPYQAFDNNPIFYADPSGADSVYNWDAGRYEDGDGNEISWDSVQAEYGIGSSCDCECPFPPCNTDEPPSFDGGMQRGNSPLPIGDSGGNESSSSESNGCCGNVSLSPNAGSVGVEGAIETVMLGSDNSSNSNDSSSGFSWRTPVGVTLIVSGQPLLGKRFVTKAFGNGPAASRGTSIASKIFSKLFPFKSPYRLPTLSGGVTTRLRWTGTKLIGRFVGRWTPFVGWGILAWDINNYLSKKHREYLDREFNGDRQAWRKSLGIHVHMACFVSGTEIIMGDSSVKKIENVKVGDIVKTYNLVLNKVENNEVVKIDSPIHGDLIKISFENGIHNINTQDHPYYVKGKGWASFNPNDTNKRYGMNVSKLELNDICYFFTEMGLTEVKIIKISQQKGEEKTFNLSGVRNNHNFFANGILVHNKLKK